MPVVSMSYSAKLFIGSRVPFLPQGKLELNARATFLASDSHHHSEETEHRNRRPSQAEPYSRDGRLER